MAVMAWALREYVAERPEKDVADVGSYDVNGSYKSAVEGLGFRSYTGLDIREGANVDQVIEPAAASWASTGAFDVVISGQTLEHTQNPFRFLSQLATILKPGGEVVLLAPWSWPVHYHPIDCWRILPEGLKSLIEGIGMKVRRMGSTTYDNGNGDSFIVAHDGPAEPCGGRLKTTELDSPAGKFYLRLEDHSESEARFKGES